MKEEVEKLLKDQPTKYVVKRLKEITLIIMPTLVDIIFEPTDTCFCSLTSRKKYKKDFETNYRQVFP